MRILLFTFFNNDNWYEEPDEDFQKNFVLIFLFEENEKIMKWNYRFLHLFMFSSFSYSPIFLLVRFSYISKCTTSTSTSAKVRKNVQIRNSASNQHNISRKTQSFTVFLAIIEKNFKRNYNLTQINAVANSYHSYMYCVFIAVRFQTYHPINCFDHWSS